MTRDKNFCGLGKFNTGKNDAWWKRGVCQAHDLHFTKLDKGEWATFGEFAKGIGRGMLEGAWMLLTGPVYLAIGGFLGVIRQQQLKKRRQLKEQNENLPPDLGDSL